MTRLMFNKTRINTMVNPVDSGDSDKSNLSKLNIQDRPADYYREVNKSFNAARLSMSKRIGSGNYDIQRNGFLHNEPLARTATFTEQTPVLELGEKTLEKLFNIKVDDPDDKLWLAEKARRITAGETEEQIKANPPFGRPQIQINKLVNFAQSNLKLDEKIDLIKTTIDQSSAITRADFVNVGTELALILGNLATFSRLTDQQLQDIYDAVNKLNIPKDWKVSFANLGRLISYSVFNANKGPIIMYLMSNIPAGLSLNQPVYSWHTGKQQYDPVGILQVFQMKKNVTTVDERYLDLEMRSLDTAASLKLKGLTPPP